MNDDNEQKNVEMEYIFDTENETLVDENEENLEKEEEKKNGNKAVLLIISLLYILVQVCQYSANYQKEYDRRMEIYNAERELLDHISSASSYYEYEEEEEEPFSLTGPQVYVLEKSNEIYNCLKIGMNKKELIDLMGEPDTEKCYESEEYLYWYGENGTKYGVIIKKGIVDNFICDYTDPLYNAYCDEQVGLTREEIISMLGEPDSEETYNKETFLSWNSESGIQKACVREGRVTSFNYDEIYLPDDGVNKGMTKEEVIKLRGEPDSNRIKQAWASFSWYDENNVKYSLNLQNDEVIAISRDLESSSDDNIQLSTELGTEIEDLEILKENLKDGMEFSEVIGVLGDKYIELKKGIYYCHCVWYDKKENYLDIWFEKNGDFWTINLLGNVDKAY